MDTVWSSNLNGLAVAVIVDDLRIARWQAEALSQLGNNIEVVLVNCTNTRFRRRAFKHALYYLLNIVSLKMPLTRSVAFPSDLKVVERIDFNCDWDGAWQQLPAEVIERLIELRPDVAIKFGMGLLKVPPRLKCKILSFHHGDPREFRGRPAGFYELLGGTPVVGQIVQAICDRLDAGNVVAFAETRVRPHSYRATMANAYRISPLLMRKAVENCLAGKIVPMVPEGRNHRLPSNGTVARFMARVAGEKMKRLAYGILCENGWQVARADLEAATPDQIATQFPMRSAWRITERPRRYNFIADPFPHPRDGLLVEALRRSDGQGEILHIGERHDRVLCRAPGHFSYPSTICAGNENFMVPEVAEWSSPKVYRIVDHGLESPRELEIEGNPRLLDPTLHSHGDRIYLFANKITEGADVLRLWVSETLFGPFVEHPSSPIRISPAGARMGGCLLTAGSRLYRIGQDCRRRYGDGVLFFEITRLSPTEYEEAEIYTFAFGDVAGPHTLNFKSGEVIFDFYRRNISPFAGIRRARAWLQKRKALASNRA